MACTRDKNSKGNYCLEQKGLEHVRQNLAFYNAPNGHAYRPAFPDLYNNGHVPADVLSCNNVDIESALFGIDSCNLVNPKSQTVAELKKLPSVSFFERPQVIRPAGVYPDNSQRPFII